MKKITILTALSVMSLTSFVFAEDTSKNPATPVVTAQKTAPQQDIKNVAQKKAESAKQNAKANKQDTSKKIGQYQRKGIGSRSLAQFKRMDKDSNGTISQAEFTAAHVEKFNKKDKNKDGNVSQAEFSPTLAKIAQQPKN